MKKVVSSKKSVQRPKLVIATDNFLPRHDGISTFLSEIIPFLKEIFDITVIAPDFGVVVCDGFTIIKIPLRKGKFGDMKFAKIKYRIIKREIKKSDLVFVQTIGPIGMPAVIASKRLRKPVVNYVHSLEAELIPMAISGTPLRKLAYSLMRLFTSWIYNKPDLLITPSEFVDDQLSWNNIVTPKRVIRLGVDTDKFKPDKNIVSSFALKKKLGFSEDDFVIGQVGRLAREKDIKTFVRSFIRLHNKDKKIKLLFVGEGINQLDHLLNRDGVINVGRQKNVVDYLRIMDVFVMSSLTETTCLAALEAMSVGLPIISTPVGFVKDYIQEEKNGLFFPFKDTYALSKQILWVKNHPTLAKRMGKDARLLVKREFSWLKTKENLSDVLLAVMKGEVYSNVGTK